MQGKLPDEEDVPAAGQKGLRLQERAGLAGAIQLKDWTVPF
jgi:hypothetical protein